MARQALHRRQQELLEAIHAFLSQHDLHVEAEMSTRSTQNMLTTAKTWLPWSPSTKTFRIEPLKDWTSSNAQANEKLKFRVVTGKTKSSMLYVSFVLSDEQKWLVLNDATEWDHKMDGKDFPWGPAATALLVFVALSQGLTLLAEKEVLQKTQASFSPPLHLRRLQKQELERARRAIWGGALSVTGELRTSADGQHRAFVWDHHSVAQGGAHMQKLLEAFRPEPAGTRRAHTV